MLQFPCCYTTIVLYLSAMSSGNLRDFQNNLGIFCEFWILLNIDRTWYIAGCCKAYFRFGLFVFDKFDCHGKNLSLKLKLTNGRTTLCWPCTLPLWAIIVNLMSVGLMADWGFPQLDLQGYCFLVVSHTLIILLLSSLSRGKLLFILTFFADSLALSKVHYSVELV